MLQAFQALTQQLFDKWPHPIKCFELCYVSLSFFPFNFACEQATLLVQDLKSLHTNE